MPKYYFKFRSAVTGRFISEKLAKKRPKTTIRIKVKK